MDSGELHDAFRVDTEDREQDPLWSSPEIFRFVDEAQKMFCRLTEGIEDSRTPSVTRLEFLAGQEWAPISPKILKIRAAYDADGREIELVSSERAAELGVRFRGHQASRIRALAEGFDQNAVRAWPTPSAATTVSLSVFRLPLCTIEDRDQALEIPEHHHFSLLLWMRYLAYSKQDAETFDRRQAEESAQRFRQYCAQARAEQTRRRRPITAIAYGGI